MTPDAVRDLPRPLAGLRWLLWPQAQRRAHERWIAQQEERLRRVEREFEEERDR